MKKAIVIVLVMVGLFAKAQMILPLFPNAEEITKLKNSKLIVALMDTSDKKFLLAREYNNNLMFALKNKWTLCSYEFASIADVVAMKEVKDDVYFMVPTETETTNFNAKPFNRDAFHTSLSYITIGKAKDLKVKKKLIGNNYAVLYNKPVLQSITGSYDFISIITAVKEIQDRALYITGSKEEKASANAKLRVGSDLRTKTLLIDKGILAKDMNEASIKAIYNYPFKIVGTEEILLAIRNKENDKAFIQTEPMSSEKAMDFIFVKACGDLNYIIAIAHDRGDAIGSKKIKEINELASRDKK